MNVATCLHRARLQICTAMTTRDDPVRAGTWHVMISLQYTNTLHNGSPSIIG